MSRADLVRGLALVALAIAVGGGGAGTAYFTSGVLSSLFGSHAAKSTWPPANTKRGSEFRALMRTEAIFSSSPSFVNGRTRLLRNNTSASCRHLRSTWTCTLRAPNGETTTLDVDAAGVVSLPARIGGGAPLRTE